MDEHGQTPTMRLLTSGGDRRIACDPATGLNAYGCAPHPDDALLSYGSSTASTISRAGFDAASRLAGMLAPGGYAGEMERIRAELIHLHGLGRTDIVFAPSGTDLHLFMAQLAAAPDAPPPLAILVAPAETGSGVHAAMAGCHFSDCAAFAPHLLKGGMMEGARPLEIAAVACREADGAARLTSLIDSEVEALTEQGVASGQHVLLTLIDVSKTGLIAPSPPCALALKRRFADKVEILVDACQFRLAPVTLRAYLEQDFIVAVTGSKFVGGPAFSAALLVPEAAAGRLSRRAMRVGLAACSVRADWPSHWAVRGTLPEGENQGLLLRWEAALAELRAFHALPEAKITAFLSAFAAEVSERLSAEPSFDPLPLPPLRRFPAAESWDRIPTIFPFLLRRSDGVYMHSRETALVYKRLQKDHCHIGQPVAVGVREGKPVSALRLCMGMRLVVDALSKRGRGAKTVMAEALSLLGKTAALTRDAPLF